MRRPDNGSYGCNHSRLNQMSMPPTADAVAAINKLMVQGVACHQQGRLEEAEKYYRQALALAPLHAGPYDLLGAIAQQNGNYGVAVDLMRRAVELRPSEIDFHLNLANALLAKGDARESELAFRRLLTLAPNLLAATGGFGFALLAQGKTEALPIFEQVARLEKNRWEAAFNLACACEQLGKPEQALDWYERALVLEPRAAQVLSNLGNLKSRLKRYAEAEADLRRALALEPSAAIAELNLGTALLAQGKTAESIACFRRAVALNPAMPEAYNNLARALQDEKEFDEQVRCCEQALTLRPDYPNAMVNLGCALREQGRTSEAMEWFKRAAAINPGDQGALSNIQFSMILLPGYDRAALSRANRDFWLNRPVRDPQTARHANTPDPKKRLRVGYVSADLRRHAAAYFMDPILAHHDKREFEVFCYYSHAREDEYTARFKTLADGWRNIADAADSEVAAMVAADGIDILVDLGGHTVNSRLTVFADHPAPVQVTYLGYPATTGLAAMDYRLTDAIADPAGNADAWYREKLWRLADSLWCYAPPADLPEVSELPALNNGYVTFGSFNNVNKIGPELVALWARILKGVPGSRLLLTSVPKGHAQQRMQGLFAADGIEASRLEMVATLQNVEFLKLYRSVDVALDSFPCNGATSTCESLWMGVPVISLAGDTFAGRAGLSLLTASGLAEWIAFDEKEYLAIAMRLAGRPAVLAAIREELREKVSHSALGDGVKFVLGLERAYRDMWSNWCGAYKNPSALV